MTLFAFVFFVRADDDGSADGVVEAPGADAAAGGDAPAAAAAATEATTTDMVS